MVPADFGHALDLADVLRPADRAEVEASSGDVLTTLVHAVEDSAECWAVYIDDRLACVWGVVHDKEFDGRVGIGWLLTSQVIERHAKAFWKLCRDELPRLLERWDVLVNAIDARHTKALAWAKRLGFCLLDAVPHGVAGLPFVPFAVRKEDLRV